VGLIMKNLLLIIIGVISINASETSHLNINTNDSRQKNKVITEEDIKKYEVEKKKKSLFEEIDISISGEIEVIYEF